MAVPLKRCAVYTRKSSEEGLDMDFNSLQAQREACEAYIVSQRGEGWKLVPNPYDDGGISGGTMDRPGLKALLADIQTKKIDVVVVYKVDRLTRSLADFAKMVEVFDAHGVSFVAVTQQFNTTTSMGRLTLNVLLSFAQFEREVTGERIRDKIALSKRRGIWMGGQVPLGYDVKDRKLLINPEEAERVRHIYRTYLESKGVIRLARILKQQNLRTKTRSYREGRHFGPGYLAVLLSNPIYIGKIRHRKEVFDGQHEPIIDQKVWDAVQTKLRAGVVRKGPRKTDSSPLMKKIFDETGRALMPKHAAKGGRRLRYYVSNPYHRPDDAKDSGWSLPAQEFERRVSGLARSMLDDAAMITSAALAADIPDADIRKAVTVAAGTNALDAVSRVDLRTDGMTIRVSIPHAPPIELVRHVSMTMRRRGVELKIVMREAEDAAEPDAALINTIGRALRWWDQLLSGAVKYVDDLAEKEGVTSAYIRRHLPLAFLSPTLMGDILAGSQEVELTATRLLNKCDVPLAWGAR